MGRRRTEVAREASRLVLLDDDFTTFVEAIREGRKVFDDIRQAFAYLLAVHVPIILLALRRLFWDGPCCSFRRRSSGSSC
jgi:Ca2+-transporting ATPase